MQTNIQQNPEQFDPQSVAVVVPMSSRLELSNDEQISMCHLEHYLGIYDKFLVLPEGSSFSRNGFQALYFDKKYFGSVTAHNKLMLSKSFYELFSKYEFILIYHLDALVFSDQLEQWCTKGLDYIGAPLFPSSDTPNIKVPRVGNGGFSLRRVKSFLKVLSSENYAIEPREYARILKHKKEGEELNYIQYLLRWPWQFFKRLKYVNGVQWEISHISGNEDRFWSQRAINYYPDFKIASFDQSFEFSFECEPRMCFEKNDRRLPFGCHAWSRYDRAFWEPYLLFNNYLNQEIADSL